jgi:hypothetical protein
MTTPSSELHLILVWHNALGQADRILADAEEHFTVHDVLRVHWSAERFSRNLTKFYDDDLPPGSDKERHCGVGEFMLIVVEDESPEHGRRTVSRGGVERVSTKMHAAKTRYREWTGGGHRIHTSLDSREFARDSFLLLGRQAERYRPGAPPWDGEISDLRVDLVGTDGWDDVQQLVHGLELTGPFVVLERTAAGDLTLLVEDFWSATVMATGAKPAEERFGRHELVVGGRPCTLELHEVGGGHLDPDWQADMLARRVRDAEGLPVLAPEDRLHYVLYRRLFYEPDLLQVWVDRADAERAIEDYLARMGYGHARARAQAEPPPEPSRLHSVAYTLKLRAARAAARVHR